MFIDHMATKHSFCYYCEKQFKDNIGQFNHIELHLLKKHSIRIMSVGTCKICSYRAEDRFTLIDHVASKHNSCYFCENTFEDSDEAAFHLNEKHKVCIILLRHWL